MKRILSVLTVAYLLTLSLWAKSPAQCVSGIVKYSDGMPAVGVSVSDGFSVVATDANGRYSIPVCSDSWFVYISYPSDALVTLNDKGQPDYYQRLVPSHRKYNFTLSRQEVEKRFNVFAIGDIHCTTDSHPRLVSEVMPAINNAISTFNDCPGYCLSLGDLINNEKARNTSDQLPRVKACLYDLPLPVFITMGNHDFTWYDEQHPLFTDPASSTIDLKWQRLFDENFGPANYSFNRGGVHFVVMRDIQPDDSTRSNHNHVGFTDAQIEWLRQDLANVEKDKKVILSVHIPLAERAGNNIAKAIGMIASFKGEVFSAHTHYKNFNPTLGGGKVCDHIHCSIINTRKNEVDMCCDGSPKGITVYTFEDNSLVDEHFFGIPSTMTGHQMRAYRGGLKYGGKYGYFQTSSSREELFINVFNADKRWKSVDIYENGVKTGCAEHMPSYIGHPERKFSVATMEPGKTYVVPQGNSQDWWAIGYIKGVYGYMVGTGLQFGPCSHMYHYILNDPDAQIKIVATDPYGNEYTCTDIIEDGTDYRLRTTELK